MSDEPGLETRTSSEKTGEGTVAPIGQIGAYTLIRTLGEGGMGTVYLAEQTTPVERRVALKVINLGMDTREIVARFEAERQALAVMDHPGIARVFDGGATDTGRPFFAMEFVQGEPITQFADRAALGIRERVALLIDVCRAVQHAHQKGIIHRDLKPSNVLVTLQDGQPAAKIIDFGIAKAIERPPDQTFATGVGQFVGTPAYMSPEQLGLTNQDVDTRADIYSLGVMLYELLAAPGPLNRPMGQRPTPRVTGPPRPFRDICAEGPAGVSRDSRRSSASKPRSTNSRLAEHDDGRARI
jgi:serine/threonine protein kinase